MTISIYERIIVCLNHKLSKKSEKNGSSNPRNISFAAPGHGSVCRALATSSSKSRAAWVDSGGHKGLSGKFILKIWDELDELDE